MTRIHLCLLTLFAASCQAVTTPAGSTAAERKPFQRGEMRLFFDTALAANFEGTVDTILGEADPEELLLDFEGKLALRAGHEIFVADGLSVRYGVDYRRFEPTDPRNDSGALNDFFSFEEVDYLELFAGIQWMPERLAFGPEKKIRPYVGLKAGWVEGVKSKVGVDFQSEFLEKQSFDFEGNEFWNAGATLGLVYPVNSSLSTHLGWTYEIPLGDTRDAVTLYPVPALPDFPVPISMAIEPEGWMIFFGVSYAL